MKCGKCGKEIPEGSLFCLHCGSRIEEPSIQDDPQPKEAAGLGKTEKQTDSSGKKMALKKPGKILIFVFAVILLFAGIGKTGKSIRYSRAVRDMEEENYAQAIAQFQKLEDYKDSQSAVRECCYLYGRQLLDSGDLEAAKGYFEKADSYRDAEEQLLECDYRMADILLEQGDYAEAEACFAALETYQDSAEKVFACRYFQAEELLEKACYEEALALFLRTSGYQDAETYIHECQYQLGQQQLREQDYLDAYEYLQYVPGDYKDTEEVVVRCCYHIARDYYEAGDYESAFAYADGLDDKSLLEYDTWFFDDLRIRYIEILLTRDDNGSIEEALYLLEGMNSTNQVRSLIKKAQNLKNQNIYDDGMYYLNAKQYTNAIRQFEKIQDYSDAKQQWLEAMYGYVQSNKYKFDGSSGSLFRSVLGDSETFYGYAKTLSDNNYKDSRGFYKELTAWHMEITMNDSENSSLDANSASKYDSIYAHLKLSGGPLDGETKIRYVFTLPSGSTVSGYFDWLCQEGDSGYCWCYYNDPYRGAPGTCVVKIYDGSGNLIGQDQIRLTY